MERMQCELIYSIFKNKFKEISNCERHAEIFKLQQNREQQSANFQLLTAAAAIEANDVRRQLRLRLSFDNCAKRVQNISFLHRWTFRGRKFSVTERGGILLIRQRR